ncbi:MAG: HAMP domain-containing histidine kinase [Chloroherpetonaceae bacterium]|nr:HAMP domain-containing histidine kinase [Chloroherpetonaceae bacterium]MDW8437257.1 HAMP domain-containing sensor histidine kinase [Chloroherpetonaceae bacterium]
MKNSVIKGFFLFSAALGAIVFFLFTQKVIDAIREQQRQKVDLWVKSLNLLIELENPQEISFIFNEIVTVIDFPAMLTDAQMNPSTIRNIAVDSSKGEAFVREFLEKKRIELDAQYEPVAVKLDTMVLQYVHYGDSDLVKALRLAPILSSVAAGVFIVIAYFSFSAIRRNEQSLLWIALSKETAHQLGTPISSLMGWIELLKTASDNPEKQAQIIFEMQTDLKRLNRVATRFSKIGSKVSLKEESVNEVIASMFNYYRSRIPQMGKSIELELNDAPDLRVPMNRELFEWVIENIVKNGIDAIQGKTGKIAASVGEEGKFVCIDISDTGKGIESKHRKDIFKAGFTTKSRGWGLGLSLAKRIVEDYHKGKLILKHSEVGKGSTFRIKLPKSA